MSSAAWIFTGLLVLGPLYCTSGSEEDAPFPDGFPKIVEGPAREVLDAGRDVVLSCRTEGDPEPKVTWLRDSVPVDTTDSRYSMVDGSSLQITNLRNRDSGHYECMAENSLGTVMSDPALLFVRDESNVVISRHRRSLWNLKDMVKSVTGREGEDFVNYGNWCGLGGSGDPVDAIDECCRNHDFCYDLATRGACKKNGKKGVYNLDYKWIVADDGTAVCNDEKDECKMEICFCDAIISNCLKGNIDAFDPSNQHELDVLQMLEAANWISS